MLNSEQYYCITLFVFEYLLSKTALGDAVIFYTGNNMNSRRREIYIYTKWKGTGERNRNKIQ